LLGLQWSVFCPPDHLTIWTARGLRSALSRAGFRCLRIRREGLNPCEILARVGRRDTAAINRQQAAVNLNSAFSTTPFRKAAKRCVNRVISAAGAGDSIKVWATPTVTPAAPDQIVGSR
jgi:hypothetical protein